MTRDNDSLARAIESLGAVDLGEGRYAIPPTHNGRTFDSLRNPGRWHTITADGLLVWVHGKVQRYFDRELTAMPSWWTPEQRFAWRVTPNMAGEPVIVFHAPSGNEPQAERITADLASGEEIPA